jgi:tetratricopeptide (TPR) repeat protein
MFEKCHSTRNIIIACMALIAITLVVYWQVGSHEFISYDDDDLITGNPYVASGITGRNVSWAFTSVEKGNWHPVTWLSHMADADVYGLNPRGHHLTSVSIHAVSSVLLLLLLLRITGALWQSAFVAALFALHPMHVESVAWVAERKDVLSAFFWFLTLLFYSEYSKKLGERISERDLPNSSLISHPSSFIMPSLIPHPSSPLYLLTLFSFALGLMSKSMLVTLPLVLLLLDFWPLDRYRHEGQEQGLRKLSGRIIALIKEKIPFFACSLFSGIVTIYAQHNAGAMSSLQALSFLPRLENALIAYVKYITKTLWPYDLAVLYPLTSSFPIWQVVGSLLILLLLSVAAIRIGRRYPYFPVGWFWFIITLLPVIGLIQVGAQSMADRYSYIPIIGLFIIAAWGVSDLAKGLRHRERILALLAVTVITASIAMTWQQLRYWRDDVSLYKHTLQVTTGNYLIHNSLGSTLAKKGDLDGAIVEYQKALKIAPDFSKAHYNMGFVLTGKGNLDAAIREYTEALRINPNDSMAHNNLGLVLGRKGLMDAAILQFKEALRITPDLKAARTNLEIALAQRKRI